MVDWQNDVFYSLCATRQDRRQDVFENVATQKNKDASEKQGQPLIAYQDDG